MSEERQPTNFDSWVLETVSPFLIPVIQRLTKLVLWVGKRTKTITVPEDETASPAFPSVISEVAKFSEADWEKARKRVFSKQVRKKLQQPYAGRRTDEGEE